MPRVLVCLDEVPAVDGTCAMTAWVEQPPILPELSAADVQTLAPYIALVLASAWAWKEVTRAVFR